jgi:hypothetical protein
MPRGWGWTPLFVLCAVGVSATLLAQTPRPAPAVPQPAPATAPRAPAPPQPAAARPTEAELGVSIYPTAVFLRSYDAGRGQKYFVFGVNAPFAEMVTYYRNILKEKGNLVFEVPATHVFEIGRFREETMAFPPSVTVKDYAFSGSGGFPNPVPGGTPDRFPTLIQIVPAPAGTPLP